MPLKKPSLETAVGLLLAAFAFAVYFTTMSRTIGWEDSGEIATSLYTLGIVHPTGYPTFTLLGWVFSHLPLGGRVIWRLNLMVALLTAASVFFYFRLFLFLLSERARRLFSKASKSVSSKPASGFSTTPAMTNLLAAALGAAALAFSRTFWLQGLSVEVYSFHLLLAAIATLLYLKALEAEVGRTATRDRDWRLFAFTLGLCFTNHMMTVLLAPAFLVLYVQTVGFGRRALVKIGQAIPLFALGLTPYLYLYLRAAHNPLMNWGDPSTLSNLWDHVTGLQYRAEMFPSSQVASRKLAGFFRDFPAQFGPAVVALGALGGIALWRENRRLLTFAGLWLLACVVYAVNYDFEDPNYYLNAYIAFAFLAACGVRSILKWGATRTPGGRGGFYAASAIAVAAAASPLVLNHGDLDLSHDTVVEDYARNVLGSLDANGLLFAREEQILTMPAIYLQTVEGVRPDVTVMNVQWLPLPWFHHYIEVRDPAALDRSRAAQRPTYATLSLPLREGVSKVPQGMVWRLSLDSLEGAPAPIDIRFNPIEGQNVYKNWIRDEYARAFYNQGIYRGILRGDTAEGIRWFERSLAMKPGNSGSLDGLRKLQAPKTPDR